MFDKNVDLAILGKNYLSLLMGLENVLNKRHVLLLDDNRYKLGDDYLNGINEFEKKFLDAWIEKQRLREFIDLDDYLKYQDIVFLVSDKRIRLGRNYWSNLFELVRKLDFKWDLKGDLDGVLTLEFKNEFNQMMEFYLDDLVSRMINSKVTAHSLYELFLSTAPELLKHIYQVVKNGFLEGNRELARKDTYLQALLFSAKGFYQYDTDNEIKDEEFFHLFISMLAPFYQIDHQKLIDHLLVLYKKQNGAFKRANVSEWSFEDSRPWAIELSSYEGIVHPKKAALFFGRLNDPCFKLSVEGPLYSSICIKHKVTSAAKTFLQTKYIICSQEMIGTSKPFWWLKLEDNLIWFKCFIEHKKGTKLSFIKKEIEAFYKSEIEKYFPDLLSGEDLDFEIYPDDDICMIMQTRGRENQGRPALVYLNKDGENILTKNIYYLGPYNKRSAGLISTLMEMNIFSYNNEE